MLSHPPIFSRMNSVIYEKSIIPHLYVGGLSGRRLQFVHKALDHAGAREVSPRAPDLVGAPDGGQL